MNVNRTLILAVCAPPVASLSAMSGPAPPKSSSRFALKRSNATRVLPLPQSLVPEDPELVEIEAPTVPPPTGKKEGPQSITAFADSTNKTGGAGQSWLAGPIAKERLTKVPPASPLRTPSPKQPSNPVRKQEPLKPRTQPTHIVQDVWMSAMSPESKNFGRKPHLEADGTLVYSDDEAASPANRPVVIRSVIDKQLLRVAELSPAKAGRKGSPLRPSVVSPEASALVKKSGKGGKQPSRWSRKQEEPAGVLSPIAPSLDDTITMAATDTDGPGPATRTDPAPTASSFSIPPAIFIPPPPGTFTRGMVIRENKGMHRLLPRFYMFIELETGPELLLMAKKKGMGSSGTYHIFDMRGLSIDSPVDGFDSKTRRYVGKLRSVSKKAAAFVLYGKGESLKKLTHLPTSDVMRDLQPELAAVCFTLPTVMQKLKQQVGPRAAIALLPPPSVPPSVTSDSTMSSAIGDDSPLSVFIEAGKNGFKTTDPKRCLANRILEKRYEPEMSPLISKEPTLTRGVFQLNFGGRVKVASIKNFQLVDPDYTDQVLIQFGKTSDSTFALDFKQPYSAIQAFGISICQFLA